MEREQREREEREREQRLQQEKREREERERERREREEREKKEEERRRLERSRKSRAKEEETRKERDKDRYRSINEKTKSWINQTNLNLLSQSNAKKYSSKKPSSQNQINESGTNLSQSGWNSSVKLEKQVFKKRKEYVNPMAVKPKAKKPTKELDINILKKKAKENLIRKKLEERKKAIEATAVMPEEDKFVRLDRVMDQPEHKEAAESPNDPETAQERVEAEAEAQEQRPKRRTLSQLKGRQSNWQKSWTS